VYFNILTADFKSGVESYTIHVSDDIFVEKLVYFGSHDNSFVLLSEYFYFIVSDESTATNWSLFLMDCLLG
jgi:hypothetical protein